jgi:hypothetical protein
VVNDDKAGSSPVSGSIFMKKRRFQRPLAEELKELYDELLVKGFTTEQSLQIVLALIKAKHFPARG